MWNSKTVGRQDYNSPITEFKGAAKEKEQDEFKVSGKMLKGMKEDTDKEMNSTKGMVRKANNEEEKVSKMDGKPNNMDSKANGQTRQQGS